KKATCSNVVTLIKHFVRFAIQEQSPIPWHALVDGPLCANVSRAVACDGVVPTRVISQNVDRVHVFEKPGARLFWRNHPPVKINLLAVAIIAAEADRIALISHNVNERVLSVET